MDLFCSESRCYLSSKEALYCYGMSKMTNPDENGAPEKYAKLQYVELLEMIGRVADLKYRGSE